MPRSFRLTLIALSVALGIDLVVIVAACLHVRDDRQSAATTMSRTRSLAVDPRERSSGPGGVLFY